MAASLSVFRSYLWLLVLLPLVVSAVESHPSRIVFSSNYLEDKTPTMTSTATPNQSGRLICPRECCTDVMFPRGRNELNHFQSTLLRRRLEQHGSPKKSLDLDILRYILLKPKERKSIGAISRLYPSLWGNSQERMNRKYYQQRYPTRSIGRQYFPTTTPTDELATEVRRILLATPPGGPLRRSYSMRLRWG